MVQLCRVEQHIERVRLFPEPVQVGKFSAPSHIQVPALSVQLACLSISPNISPV